MKQTFYSMLLFAFLAGCSSEEPFQDTPIGEAVPLSISSIRIDSEVSTRTSDIPLVEGKLGIFQTDVTFYTPAPYTYIGIGGEWTASSPLTLGMHEASVCAWFPGDYFSPSTINELARFPLDAQVYTEANDLVFLRNTGGLNKLNPSLNVRLTHAYALLSFSLKRDISYKGAGVVTGITLDNASIVKTAMMDIRDGSFSEQETVSSLSLEVSATVTPDKMATIKILVPPDNFTDTKLSLKIDGKTLVGTITGSSIGELHSGMSRTFDVTLQRNLELLVSVMPVDGSSKGDIIW